MENNNIQEEQFTANDFSIKSLVLDYLKYWYLFVISIALAFTAAYYYNWYATPIYSTYSTVLINIDRSNTDDLLKEIDGLSSGKRNIENEIQILRSRSLASKAIKKLNFDVSYFLVGDIKVSEIYDQSPFKIISDSLLYEAYIHTFDIEVISDKEFMFTYKSRIDEQIYENKYEFGVPIKNGIGSFTVEKTSLFKNLISPNSEYKKYKVKFNDTESLVSSYLSRLSIDLISRNSSILKIAIKDQVSKKGADFINTLVEVYIQSDIEEKNKLATNSLKFIDDQLLHIQADLREIEFDKEKYKSERGITDISTEASIFLDAVKQIDVKVSSYKVQREYIEYLINYLTENNSIGHIVPSTLGIDDPVLLKLIEKLIELERERERLNITSGKSNLAINNIQDEIQNMRKQILDNLMNIKVSLDISIKESNEKVNEYETQIRSLPTSERELIGIQRQFLIKENLYVYLLEKQAETAIVIASAVSDNSVIDKAPITYSPISPVKEKNYSIAILLGFFLPVLLIYIQQLINDKINNIEAIKRFTNAPILGLISQNKSKSNLIVHEKPKSAISEAFRSLRTNLKYIGIEGNQKIILVTSSISGEGKTFTCLNLSLAYAASGSKTVLVGLDLRKQKIADEFALSNEIGVSTFLAGEKEIDEIIFPSNVDKNLDVIPAGPVPPNPSELIMTHKMDSLMDYLQEKYDKIIIDSPPIGLVTDGILLTKYSSVNVIVIRQNVTSRNHMKSIQELYSSKRIDNMTILFNGVVGSGKNYNYEYGYGYGYGYGYYDEEPDSWKAKLKSKIKKGS